MSADSAKAKDNTAQVRQLTTQIVAAYVSNNTVAPSALADLIRSTYAGLCDQAQVSQIQTEAAIIKVTRGQIRKSITPDALISFVDGRPYKTLKRHLTTNGLTIAEYRALYGLPDDYPATAANYSLARSAMAKSFGLGQSGHSRRRAPRANRRD